MGEHSHLSTATASLADLVARQGRLVEAKDLVASSRAAEDDVASRILLRLALARTTLAGGDHTSATQTAAEARGIARATDLAQIKGELLLLQAEAARETGSTQQVRRLLESAARQWRRKDSPVLMQRIRHARLNLAP